MIPTSITKQASVVKRLLTLALVAGAVILVKPQQGHGYQDAARTFSPNGLVRVSNYMREAVDTKRIAGAVVLIQQHGHPVYLETFGLRNPASGQPMTTDSIFRWYSMSKPITSVAAMMLVDDGKLKLDDPVSKYIPAFTDIKVGVERLDDAGKPELSSEPLKRAVTIEDLLRHTSGITYGFYGDTAVRMLYAHADLFRGDFDNAGFVARLVQLPLADQPGMRWDYGHSVDVLGRVIEVASGQSLFQFEKERLLDPLGMRDTAFYLMDDSKRPLLAEPLSKDEFTNPVAGIDNLMRRRRWESGGAGMLGTMADYAHFAQMLLDGGTLDGRRYLKPETVALMTSDHIGPATHILRDHYYFPGGDSGFGYGFAVRTSQAPNSLLPIGEYRWSGVDGTFFFIDPRDDMFTICMMQAPSQLGQIETDMRPLVYQAMEK